MLCPLCHTQNRDNAKFCKGCGRLMLPDTEQATEQPVEAEPIQGGSPSHMPPAEQPTAHSSAPQSSEEHASPVATSEQDPDDPSMAPTQILTPQQMLAYHSRRWQQEAQHQPPQGLDIADQPTTLFESQSSDNQAQEPPDISELPTMSVPLSDEPAQTFAQTEEDSPETTAPSTAESPEATAQSAPVPEPPQSEISTPSGDISTSTQKEDSVEHATDAADGQAVETFPVLAVGAVVAARYQVTEVISAADDTHQYAVTDQKGYLHCWNCNSEDNSEDDAFCNNCGAELLNATYIMHEYPATASSSDDAHVLQGSIVNTLVDQGQTYVIELPQTSQSSFPTGVHLLAACDSDAGTVRRGEPNEDSTFILQFQRVHESISSPAGVFIVADGMGGHDNGQGASRMTVNTIASRVVHDLVMPPLTAEQTGSEQHILDEEQLLALIQGAVEDANTALCQYNQREKSDGGCTLTGFMLAGDHAYVFNVGDSRTYMLRDKKLYQLTNDHSLVGQLVAGGLIEPDDVYTHPQRSQIYRSIGDKLNVQVDLFKQQVHPNDILLSCSDGLWEMVRDPQITDILNNALDPQTACSQLIEAANNNGGEDNVSAVAVFVR